MTTNREGERHRCVGRASNPVGGATRCWVGSTPTPFRHPGLVDCDTGSLRWREPTPPGPARAAHRTVGRWAC